MQNALRFLMKKKVLPLWQITFDPLKNGLKNIHQWSKTCFFFIRNLRAFCIHFLQVLKSEYEGILNLRVLPSVGKYPQILRLISSDFWDEVFSLRIWGHSIQQWVWDLKRSYELRLLSALLRYLKCLLIFGHFFCKFWPLCIRRSAILFPTFSCQSEIWRGLG